MNLLQIAKICASNDKAQFHTIARNKNWTANINLNDHIYLHTLSIQKGNRFVSNKTTCLCIASQCSSASIVEELVSQGARPSVTDGFGDTPIHKACSTFIEGKEKVDILINRDPFQILKCNSAGGTALHDAAAHDDHRMCALFVGYEDLNINKQTKAKLSPLHIASLYGRTKNVEALLSREDINVNAQDQNGDTPSHFAARQGHVDILAMLLRHDKCNRSLVNNKGYTPDQENLINIRLLAASFDGSIADIKRLLRGGAICVSDYTGETPFHKSCRSNRDVFEKVQALTEFDPTQLTKCSRQNLLPIHLAAKNSSPKVLEILQRHEQSADINVKTDQGRTPLHIACYFGLEDNVRHILCYVETDVNAIDILGNTPLHFASKGNHQGIISFLKENPVCRTNIKNNSGLTAEQLNPLNVKLFRIAESGTIGEVQSALSEGAECISDQKGDTPLHLASCSSVDTLEKVQLLTHSARYQLGKQNEMGLLPIHIAAQQNNYNVIKYIAEQYDVNARTSQNETVLHFLARKGNTNIVHNLTLEFTDTDINIQDSNGNTAAHIAAMNDHLETFKTIQIHRTYKPKLINSSGKTAEEEMPLNIMLRSKILNYDAKGIAEIFAAGAECLTDINGDTLLHLACKASCESIEKCRLLLQHKPSLINFKNQSQQNALHLACLKKDSELVRYLVEETGVELNAKDQNKQTPLHLAAEHKQSEIIENLLQKKDISVNAEDHRKYTALHISTYAKDLKCIDALLRHPDVAVNVQDASDNTPLHIAVEHEFDKIISRLSAHPKVDWKLKNRAGQTGLILLRDVSAKKWSMQQEVKAQGRGTKIRKIKQRLWCCHGKAISVFDSSLKLLTKIPLHEMGTIHDAAETGTSDVVIACKRGLFHLDEQGAVRRRIDTGWFDCVVSHGEKLYAAEEGRINIYQCNETWHKETSFPIEKGAFATLSVKKNQVRCCSGWDGQIRVLSMSGELQQTLGRHGSGVGEFSFPFIADDDDEGDMLIADYGNDRLQVMREDGQCSVVDMQPAVRKPSSAVLYRNRLFVASLNGDTISCYTFE